MIHKFSIPKLQTFPDMTGILGILTALGVEKNWIYNNYLLLWSYERIDDENYWCDFKQGDYLIDRSMLPLKFIEYDKKVFDSKREVVIFLKKLLKKGYILTDLDTFYFDEWWTDKSIKEHNSHTVIIFGNTEEEFLCADFLKGKYGFFSGKHIDIAEAFFRGNNKIYGIEITNTKLEKNNDLLKNQILDFIHCSGNAVTNFLDLYTYENTLYGFEALKNIFLRIKICFEKNEFIDLRSIQMILIFVRVMKERVVFWNDNSLTKKYDYIMDLCVKLEDKVFNLVILCMKINYKKKYTNKDYIYGLTDNILKETTLLFEGLLECLDIKLSEVEKDILWKNWDKLKKERVIIHKHEKAIEDEINYSFFETVKVKFNDCLNEPNKLENIICDIKNECRVIYTNDFWKNVFQLDIEEKGFEKKGKIISGKEYNNQVTEKIYYFDNQNRIKMIEYKNKFMRTFYLIYVYEGNYIIRYKVDKDSKTIHQILFDIHNKGKEIQYIYADSYKKLIMYEIEKGRKKRASIYKTSDLNMLDNMWIDSNWSENQEYIYSSKNELLQIIRTDYEKNNQLIYSNIGMHLNEGLIEEQFKGILNSIIQKESIKKNDKIIINFNTSIHMVTVKINNDIYDSMIFLEEYKLYNEAVNRFTTIFSLEIFKYNEKYELNMVLTVNNLEVILEKQILTSNTIFFR